MLHISALPGQRELSASQAALYSCWLTAWTFVEPLRAGSKSARFLLQESDYSGWLSLTFSRVCRKIRSISWLKTELRERAQKFKLSLSLGIDFSWEAIRVISLRTLAWKGPKISEWQWSVVDRVQGWKSCHTDELNYDPAPISWESWRRSVHLLASVSPFQIEGNDNCPSASEG